MKRALSFLLMMVTLAGPAVANTLVVMAPDHEPSSSSTDIHFRDLQFNMVTEALRRSGATFTAVRGLQGLKTEWLRSGVIPSGRGPSGTYNCVIYCGFYNNNSTWPSAPSCRPDSTTLTQVVSGQSMWPSVPTVFLAEPQVMCSGITPTASCSLGVGACIPAGSLTPMGCAYLAGVGFPYLFTPPSVANRPFGVKVATISASKFREIICYSATSGSNGTAAALMAKDPDSTVSVNAANDTILLAALYGPTGVTTGGVTVSNVPIFVGYSGQRAYQDECIIKTALMMADSASGGKVFDKQGTLPLRRNIWISGAFTRGTGYAAVGSAGGGGVFCRADSCDSVNVKAGIDSLNALGVRFTVGVSSDSISAYPYEKAWWRRAALAHFALEEHTGTVAQGTTVGALGNAPVNHCVDPFSTIRARTPQATCAGNFDTTNVLCQLKQGLATLNTNFAGFVDHSVYPAFGDWSPTNWTRTTTSAATALSDEWMLFWDIWSAGFKTLVIHPGIIDASGVPHMVGHDGYLNSGTWTAASGAAAPIGYECDERSVPVYQTGQAPPANGLGWRVGTLSVLACRNEPQQPLWSWLPAQHLMHNEFNLGNDTGRWYDSPPINYRHMFDTHLSVMMMPAVGLGGTGRTDLFPGFQSFHVIKWAVNQTKIENYFATTWSNGVKKQLDMWDWAENVQPAQ